MIAEENPYSSKRRQAEGKKITSITKMKLRLMFDTAKRKTIEN